MISLSLTQWNRYANVWVEMRGKNDNWIMVIVVDKRFVEMRKLSKMPIRSQNN